MLQGMAEPAEVSLGHSPEKPMKVGRGKGLADNDIENCTLES